MQTIDDKLSEYRERYRLYPEKRAIILEQVKILERGKKYPAYVHRYHINDNWTIPKKLEDTVQEELFNA